MSESMTRKEIAERIRSFYIDHGPASEEMGILDEFLNYVSDLEREVASLAVRLQKAKGGVKCQK